MTSLAYFTTSPNFQSIMQAMGLLNSQWRSVLNPLLGIPLLAGVQLNNIALVSGHPNVINTTLSRNQQGWLITDIDATATVYRSEPFNSSTLTLVTSADCTISLWVY